jgi:EAL domain-containing protein (putative c-di-GMP-specific phosphodiesterase class I)
MDLLRSLGCDVAQGYYVSRPVTANALVEQLRPQSSSPTLPLAA